MTTRFHAIARIAIAATIAALLVGCDILGFGGNGGGGRKDPPPTESELVILARGNLAEDLDADGLSEEQVQAIVDEAVGNLSDPLSTSAETVLSELVVGAQRSLATSGLQEADRLDLIETITGSAVGTIGEATTLGAARIRSASLQNVIARVVEASVGSLDEAFSDTPAVPVPAEAPARTVRGTMPRLRSAGVDPDTLGPTVREVTSAAVGALGDGGLGGSGEAAGGITRGVTARLGSTGVISGATVTRRLRRLTNEVSSAATGSLGRAGVDSAGAGDALQRIARNATGALREVELPPGELSGVIGEVTREVTRSVSESVARSGIAGVSVTEAVQQVVDGATKGLNEVAEDTATNVTLNSTLLGEAVSGATTGGTRAAADLDDENVDEAALTSALNTKIDELEGQITALAAELSAVQNQLTTLIQAAQAAALNTPPTFDIAFQAGGIAVSDRDVIETGSSVTVTVTPADDDDGATLETTIVVIDPSGTEIADESDTTVSFTASDEGLYVIDVTVTDAIDTVDDIFALIADTGVTDPPAEPQFSLQPGTYVGTQTLEITTATPGATIYYRTDYDAEPTELDNRYTGPIALTQTTTINAVAIAGGQRSDNTTGSFGIRQSGFTNLVANGDFSLDRAGWYLYTDEANGAEATWETRDADGDGDPEVAIEIVNGGSESFMVQLGYDIGWPTAEGDLFQLEFDAWFEPTAGSRHDFAAVTIRIDDFFEDIDGDGEVFETYYFRQDVIPETATTISVPIAIYHSTDHDHPRTRLALDLGTEEGVIQRGTVYIDDVSLTRIDSPRSFADVVTDQVMRDVLVPIVQQERDSDTRARRFSSFSAADINAYHLATVDSLDLSDGDFEDVGATDADLNLAAIDLTAFGNLERIELDDLDVSNADVELIGAVTRLRRVSIGNTTGDADTFVGVSDVTPFAALRRLNRIALRENPISVGDLAALISPETFPALNDLSLGMAEAPEFPLSTAQTDTLVDVFTAFSTSERPFREVLLNNAGITDSQFLTLYGSLLSENPDDVVWLEFNEWRSGDGALTDAVLDEIANFTNLEGLQLEYHAGVTDLSPITGLDLESLVVKGTGIDNGDLSVIAGFDSLVELNLEDLGGLTDLAALSTLGNLDELNLERTAVTDITPISDMIAAGSFAEGGNVELRNNPQLNLAPGTPNGDVVAELESLGVEVEFDPSQVGPARTIVFGHHRIDADPYISLDASFNLDGSLEQDIIEAIAARNGYTVEYLDIDTSTGEFFPTLADALDAGTIDVLFGALESTKNNREDLVDFVRPHVTEPSNGNPIALSVRTGNDSLRAELDAAVQGLIDDGILQALYDKWGITEDIPPADPSQPEPPAGSGDIVGFGGSGSITIAGGSPIELTNAVYTGPSELIGDAEVYGIILWGGGITSDGSTLSGTGPLVVIDLDEFAGRGEPSSETYEFGLAADVTETRGSFVELAVIDSITLTNWDGDFDTVLQDASGGSLAYHIFDTSPPEDNINPATLAAGFSEVGGQRGPSVGSTLDISFDLVDPVESWAVSFTFAPPDQITGPLLRRWVVTDYPNLTGDALGFEFQSNGEYRLFDDTGTVYERGTMSNFTPTSFEYTVEEYTLAGPGPQVGDVNYAEYTTDGDTLDITFYDSPAKTTAFASFAAEHLRLGLTYYGPQGTTPESYRTDVTLYNAAYPFDAVYSGGDATASGVFYVYLRMSDAGVGIDVEPGTYTLGNEIEAVAVARGATLNASAQGIAVDYVDYYEDSRPQGSGGIDVVRDRTITGATLTVIEGAPTYIMQLNLTYDDASTSRLYVERDVAATASF